MPPHHLPEIGTTPEARIRALGFNPGQLTLEEQVEILEIHTRWSSQEVDEERETRPRQA